MVDVVSPTYKKEPFWCAIHDTPKISSKEQVGKMVVVTLTCPQCKATETRGKYAHVETSADEFAGRKEK